MARIGSLVYEKVSGDRTHRRTGNALDRASGRLKEKNNRDTPGTTCMWRSLARLPAMAQGYRLALDYHGLRSGS